MSQAKRVLIVDDHPLFRDGLRCLIAAQTDLALAGEASCAAEALDATRALCPDIICLDLSLPDKSGFTLIADLRAQSPATPLLVVSMHNRSETVVRAFRAGALGYVIKESGGATLLEGLRSVLRGTVFVDARVADEVMHRLVHPEEKAPSGPPGQAVLTGREREVMRLIAEGISTANIARQLSISARTVESHRANIMRKLGVSSMVDIVRHAVRLELVDPGDWKL